MAYFSDLFDKFENDSKSDKINSIQKINTDVCSSCGSQLQLINNSFECPSCNQLFGENNTINPEKNPHYYSPRLRIVGNDARMYQSNLDSSNPIKSIDQQKKTLLKEITKMNEEYANNGGNKFPGNIISLLVDNYHNIQQNGLVKRSAHKRKIIAGITDAACVSEGFVRSPVEIAEFAGLKKSGIAEGINYVRELCEQGILDLDMNSSKLIPQLNSIFAELGIPEEICEIIKPPITELVKYAQVNDIGHTSKLKSKLVATTIEIIRRSDLKIDLTDIYKLCSINSNTICRFLSVLTAYHNKFEHIYKKYKLNHEPFSYSDL
jgi:phenylpyruvate tautomerase PptA (4-oxalocrotonate tautomerase family)